MTTETGPVYILAALIFVGIWQLTLSPTTTAIAYAIAAILLTYAAINDYYR